jgi:NADH-quinone oxidoreductase subunit B
MNSRLPTFRYISVGHSCCGDDLLQTLSSRYDLERLGCVSAETEESTNLVILQGTINAKLAEEIKRYQSQLAKPLYWMAIGTCACSGGLFPSDLSPQNLTEIKIDVFVTGCPPRPEAIMNGVLLLHEVAQKKLNMKSNPAVEAIQNG